MYNCFINGYLERYRLLDRHDNVFDNFERHVFNLGDVDSSLDGIWDRFLHGDRNFLNDRDDYCFRDGNLDWDGMRDRNEDGLIDFELVVLVHRDNNFSVVLDRLGNLFLDVLVHGIRLLL